MDYTIHHQKLQWFWTGNFQNIPIIEKQKDTVNSYENIIILDWLNWEKKS